MGGGGSGRLFKDGRLLTFSAFGMGAYSKWALIRGWALIRIITVCKVSHPKMKSINISLGNFPLLLESDNVNVNSNKENV